jgi:hypothetical protein
LTNERQAKYPNQYDCYRHVLEKCTNSFNEKGERRLVERVDRLQLQPMDFLRASLRVDSATPHGAFLRNLMETANDLSGKERASGEERPIRTVRYWMESTRVRVLLVGLYAYAAWRFKALVCLFDSRIDSCISFSFFHLRLVLSRVLHFTLRIFFFL